MKQALKLFGLATAALALAALPAAAHVAPPPGYAVVDQDSRIDFPGSVTSFQAAGRDGIVVQSGGRSYLVELDAGCARLVPQPWAISLHPEGPTGVDKFAHVSINGHSCQVASVARIARVASH